MSGQLQSRFIVGCGVWSVMTTLLNIEASTALAQAYTVNRPGQPPGNSSHFKHIRANTYVRNLLAEVISSFRVLGSKSFARLQRNEPLAVHRTAQLGFGGDDEQLTPEPRKDGPLRHLQVETLKDAERE
jgi:hypothetical protein